MDIKLIPMVANCNITDSKLDTIVINLKTFGVLWSIVDDGLARLIWLGMFTIWPLLSTEFVDKGAAVSVWHAKPKPPSN